MNFKTLYLTFSSLTLLSLSTVAIASFSPNELVIKMKPNQKLPTVSKDIKVQNLFGDIYILRGKDASQL